MVDRRRPQYIRIGREMAAFETESQQLNSNSIVKTSPFQNSGPSAIPPIPNFPSPQQNSTNAGTKRKETGTPQNDIPYKQCPAWLCGRELFCEICNVEMNSVSQALQHRQGKVHLNKVKRVEKFRTLFQNSRGHEVTSSAPIRPQVTPNSPPVTPPTEQPRQLGSVNLQCDICQKLFNSETQTMQHFQGQKHKQKLQSIGESKTELRVSATESNASVNQQQDGTCSFVATENGTLPFSSTNGSESEGLYCEPCGLTVNSRTQMTTHLQGAKHKNIVASKRLQGGHSRPVLRCDDCMTTFNSQLQLTQHLTSPKHINKVQKKQTTRVQFRGQERGRGRGRGRARGVFRGGQSYRGRGTFKPPSLVSSFVKAAPTFAKNPGFTFSSPAQSTFTPCFTEFDASFQQPFM